MQVVRNLGGREALGGSGFYFRDPNGHLLELTA